MEGKKEGNGGKRREGGGEGGERREGGGEGTGSVFNEYPDPYIIVILSQL